MRVGCQSEKPVGLNSVYLLTSAATPAGIARIFSKLRAAGGVTFAPCANARLEAVSVSTKMDNRRRWDVNAKSKQTIVPARVADCIPCKMTNDMRLKAMLSAISVIDKKGICLSELIQRYGAVPPRVWLLNSEFGDTRKIQLGNAVSRNQQQHLPPRFFTRIPVPLLIKH